ncbi:tetratricopeptide repeat protein [Breznakibacter xylanolyticus]|uniref:Tetratricopeptide repeat protein n=1 Tax=Breznakibacter xylanolyticus TaxID=990 RepID=A0A2W7NB43_9BACT|nr:tetratricopeptide repeat protein [Breznakibacter xylanolyticus]PZX15347.1 tetratricopeptide repeat protein [Breznakibacter xylanolyticus]
MKYLVTAALAVTVLFSTVNAQEEKSAITLKNEAVDALKVKDYKKALATYEQVMEITKDAPEGVVYYNAATCARTLENYDKAIEYYKQSESLSYRPDQSAFYVGYALNKLDKDAEMEVYMTSIMEKYAASTILDKMKALVITYYLKEGSKPYNEAADMLKAAKPADQKELDELNAKVKVKFAEAKPWFEKAAKYAAADDERIVKPMAEINSRLAE